MKMELFQKFFNADHWRTLQAICPSFAIGLHGASKFHPIVKYKHYQISSRARASLGRRYVKSGGRWKVGRGGGNWQRWKFWKGEANTVFSHCTGSVP